MKKTAFLALLLAAACTDTVYVYQTEHAACSNDAAPDANGTPDAAPPPPDAALPDAPPVGGPSLGSHVLAFWPDGDQHTLLTTAPRQYSAGSVLLAAVGRGYRYYHVPPTDTVNDAFSQVGAEHLYPGTDASTRLYSAVTAGGASVPVSVTKPAWHEVTMGVVEVRGATRITTASYVFAASATTLTSATVTTSGPAVLVAYAFGAGGKGQGQHIFTPDASFTLLDALTTDDYLVQASVAARTVSAAGTYSITWTATTHPEGAQLYLIAVEP